MDAGLFFHTSNRLELLVDELVLVLGEPLSSPMASETIVVQSKGMERWLSLQLSRRLGVWSNCHYPFPNTVVSQVFDAVIPRAAEERGFDRDVIAWRTTELLPTCLAEPAFASLRGYLAGRDRSLKLHQLCSSCHLAPSWAWRSRCGLKAGETVATSRICT